MRASHLFVPRSPAAWALALAASLAVPATAAPQDATVSDAQEVRGFEFAPRAAARRGPGASARREGRLRFEARGRQFDLDLRENAGLLDALPAADRSRLRGRHEVYAGELTGRPDSWVRLTRTGNRWRGLVFDGEELLALEPGQRLGRGPGAGLALYRADDVATTGTCALDPEAELQPSYARLLDELEELPPALGAASGQLDVALVGDPSFVQGEADPEGTALAIMNAVDGIYADQVGVSLRVVELILLQGDAGLTSTDAGTLLGQLSSLTSTGAVTNPGLVHLLTGRNLNGSTVGIAYVGVLCNTRFGVGLSQMLSGSLAATTVLVAHEIGHNFAAPHDDQTGSVCASTPGGYIMSPWLDASATQFSACSLDQMALEVASASCIADLPDEPPPLPACSNGIDDDGDGRIDFGQDLKCRDADDPSEDLGCQDGYDNDGDGLVDFPEDPQCRTARQWSESDRSCGLGFEIVPTLLPLVALRRRRGRTRVAAR